jgi:hypothetical protein
MFGMNLNINREKLRKGFADKVIATQPRRYEIRMLVPKRISGF